MYQSLIKNSAIILFSLFCHLSVFALEFTLIDYQGKVHNEKQYKDQYLIVNYWATWCPPCLKEIPVLIDYYNKHKDKVAVFGLNSEHIDESDLSAFIEKNNINYPIFPWVLENDFDQFEPLKVLPTTLIYDQNKQLIKTHLGEITEQQLNVLLNLK